MPPLANSSGGHEAVTATSSGREAGLRGSSVWDVRLPEEAQADIPTKIFLPVGERRNSNGLKLPRRIRLNIRQSFLTARVAENQNRTSRHAIGPR